MNNFTKSKNLYLNIIYAVTILIVIYTIYDYSNGVYFVADANNKSFLSVFLSPLTIYIGLYAYSAHILLMAYGIMLTIISVAFAAISRKYPTKLIERWAKLLIIVLLMPFILIILLLLLFALWLWISTNGDLNGFMER